MMNAKVKRLALSALVAFLVIMGIYFFMTGSPVSFKLGRDGFVEEVLYPQATRRTPRFNDYTPGSYHVSKLDLAAGVQSARTEWNLDVRALAIIGPSGPIWSYRVLAFIGEGDVVRVNCLVFPHARLTFKSTKTVSAGELDTTLDSIIRSAALVRGAPTLEMLDGSHQEVGGLEWCYDFLLVDWRGGDTRMYHSTNANIFAVSPGMVSVYTSLDAIMTNAVTTYSHGITHDPSAHLPKAIHTPGQERPQPTHTGDGSARAGSATDSRRGER